MQQIFTNINFVKKSIGQYKISTYCNIISMTTSCSSRKISRTVKIALFAHATATLAA